MADPNELTPPAVNIPFVVPSTGNLTQYGRSMLDALTYRTGGAGGGSNIDELKIYINQQIQDDRESPVAGVAALLRPSAPAGDLPPNVYPPQPLPDEASLGMMWAIIAQLQSRIAHLEESR